MNAAQLARLREQPAKLRLTKSRERLEALLQDAVAKELSYADFVDQLLTEKIVSKTAENVSLHINLAHFPFVKSFPPFDFSCRRSLQGQQVHNLAGCYFIEHGYPVSFTTAAPPPLSIAPCTTPSPYTSVATANASRAGSGPSGPR